MREHFRATARRKKQHRECVRLLMRGKTAPPMPVTVTLTRRSFGTLDGHDNLPSAFKNVVDELAAWLGVDDADPRVTWRYAQEKTPRGVFGVIVEVVPA